MNLTAHLLKKDIRRSQILLLVWLLLVVFQFVLIGSGINPADKVMQVLYYMISLLVPLFQALLLIVIIPHVIQDEPLVGTTAFWFTRPIARPTLLKAKSLFALLLLLLPPLIAELIVLAANGVTPSDIALAVPEIIIVQLALILPIAVLAVITPSFGRFAAIGAVLFVGMMIIFLAIYWTRLFLNPESFMSAAQNFSLEKSRGLAGDLLSIPLGCLIIAHQYLTRKTARTIMSLCFGVAVVIAAEAWWPWDFFHSPPAKNQNIPFDIGKVKIALGSDANISDVPSIRGGGTPKKNIYCELDTPGIPSGYVVSPTKIQPHLKTSNGQSINVRSPLGLNEFMLSGEIEGGAMEKALGEIPVANSNYNISQQTSLFNMDADAFGKYANQSLDFSADIDFVVSQYVVVVEIPLKKNTRWERNSEHLVITDILHQGDGMDVLLQLRWVNLLFDRNNKVPLQQEMMDRQSVVYLLLNKKRREAVLQKQDYSFDMNMMGVSNSRLVNRPLRLSFGPDRNASHLFPELNSDWLADAELVRLELEPVAEFSKKLVVNNFKLNGNNAFISREQKKSNLETLGKIVLPEKATKDQIKEYVNEICLASRKQTTASSADPQVQMLIKVGHENLDVLIDAFRGKDSNSFLYLKEAINELARPEHKSLVLEALPYDHFLASILLKFGWQADAKETLVGALEKEDNLPLEWIQAVASFQDPSTYPGLKAYFRRSCLQNHTYYDAIKNLPGLDLSDDVTEIWKKAKFGSSSFDTMEMCPVAAEFGHADALELSAKALETEKNDYDRGLARDVLRKFTPATGNDQALIAWFKANKDRLVFDPQTKKFKLKE